MSLSCAESGEIACASSGDVYILTTNSALYAPQCKFVLKYKIIITIIYIYIRISKHTAKIDEQNKEVEISKMRKITKVTDISKQPKQDVLQVPGNKDGKSILIQKNNKVYAYTWNQDKYEWILQGEMIGKVNETEKKTYNGKEYDKVIQVEIDEGNRTVDLPFNVDDDPEIVAKEFQKKHNIYDNSYEEKIIEFIKPMLDPIARQNRIEREKQELDKNTLYQTPIWKFSFYLTNITVRNKVLIQAIKTRNIEFSSDILLLHYQLNDTELGQLHNIIRVGQKAGNIEPPEFTNKYLEIIKKLLQWPTYAVTPCLDLVRILLCHTKANELLIPIKKQFHYDQDNSMDLLLSDNDFFFIILCFSVLDTTTDSDFKEVVGSVCLIFQCFQNWIAFCYDITSIRINELKKLEFENQIKFLFQILDKGQRVLNINHSKKIQDEFSKLLYNQVFWAGKIPSLYTDLQIKIFDKLFITLFYYIDQLYHNTDYEKMNSINTLYNTLICINSCVFINESLHNDIVDNTSKKTLIHWLRTQCASKSNSEIQKQILSDIDRVLFAN